MIYDKPLTTYKLPDDVGTPLQGTLVPCADYYYGDVEVYHARYWEAVQSGSRVDRMCRVLFGDEITATMYAIPEDGHVYRIVQAQHGQDDDGNPSTMLSLQREERYYEIARV